jgi:ABC-2 type transport system permease protein
VTAATPAESTPRHTLTTHDASGSVWAISAALAQRSMYRIFRVPAAIVPVVVMPIFFVVAFGGAFSSLVDIPGFPTDNALNWFLPWAILQGAAFAGVGAAFTVGTDLEGGFMDRLLLAPMRRISLLTGPCLAAMVRCLLPVLLVTPIAFAGGARLTDGPIGFLTLFIAVEGLALIATLWGLAVTFRMRTQRSSSLIQVGIFVSFFLSVSQVPLELLTGWLHEVATYNPMTYVLDLARQGFLDDGVTWDQTWPGLLALVAGIAVFGAWAWRGAKKLTD